MDAGAGMKRKLQVGQLESRKRRETESPYQVIKEIEIDFESSVNRDQELEISDTSDEEDEHPELKEDSLKCCHRS